jgi:hypothetical protein
LKVLLRHLKTGLYMNSNEWTQDVDKARDFKSSTDILNFVVEHGLTNVEAFYAFPDQRYNFAIRLKDARNGACVLSDKSVCVPV